LLFNRVASLVIGKSGGKGVELDGLRFSFDIEKGSTKNVNKCTVKVYNTRPETRSLIETIGNVLILKAGYEEQDGASAIFVGNVTRSLTVKEGADWITELELQDGFYEFRDSKITVSYDEGASAIDVLKDIASKFLLPIRPLPSDLTDKQYPSGFSFVGRVRDAMDKVCDYLSLEWSIQNRQIQIIKKGGTLKQKAIVLSSNSGMVGHPQRENKTMSEKAAAKKGVTSKQTGVRKFTKTDKDGDKKDVLQVFGYKVKSLLQPSLEPGGLVQVKSVGINGEFFRIETVKHSGDTHGNDWHTELTLRYPK